MNELESLWKKALSILINSSSEQEKAMWLDLIVFDSAKDDTVCISLPSKFHSDQIKHRYLPQLLTILENISGRPIKIEIKEYKNKKSPSQEKSVGKSSAKTGGKQNFSKVKPASSLHQDYDNHPQLREDYTFDSFVIGDNNAFAANAGIAISRNPGQAWNPFLIYGGVGLGKTHLMQSIGNAIYKSYDNIKLVYVPAETFINEFTFSIRTDTAQQFKNKYRNVDVLLLDDIHYLQKRTGTQEELFHTFNALYDANKQMVFTCDRPVMELKDITERLKNRFVRGLNVDLQPPNFETRIAILKQKMETQSFAIPQEVIDFIATNITTNVRDMEAALTKLTAYAELVGKNVTLKIAEEQLKHIFSGPAVPSQITIGTVQRIVAEYFGFTPNDLKSKRRTKAISFPRQIAMYILREITDFSTTEIGLEFGGRDHTTVMHSVQRIEDKMKSDPTLEPTIQQLIEDVKNSQQSG